MWPVSPSAIEERFSFKPAVLYEIAKRQLIPSIAFLALALGFAGSASANASIICPMADARPSPPFAKIDSQPNFAGFTGRNLDGANCLGGFSGPVEQAAALSARFIHSGSVSDLAERVGAISSLKGLRYWSVTERGWRELISEAHALSAPAADARRGDFSAREVLSGRRLYFAQDDSRSSGLNVYRFRTIRSGAAYIVFMIDNLSSIRFAGITLIEPKMIASIHYLQRESADVWRYFGLAIIRKGLVDGDLRSLINREAAVFRHLAGIKPDGMPPLAP